MRTFSFCYGLMTLTLGSMVVYGMANADKMRCPFGDPSAFALNAAAKSQPTMILPAVTARPAPAAPAPATDLPSEAASNAPAADAAVEFLPSVSPGMSADEVEAILGEPDAISPDGARWSYDSSVLIFGNNTLVGHVAFDPVQAALNKYNNMMTGIATVSPDDAARNAKAGGKILRLKTASRHVDKYLYRPMIAGSARNAYRYDENHNEYSYYMNRSGPLDRTFAGKLALPRGMTSSAERNLAGSYLSNHGSTYGTYGGQQYRR